MSAKKHLDGLSVVAAEIRRQRSELEALLTSWKHDNAREGSIFVGAGDSYAAAHSASFLSSLKIRALDPYALHESPEIARGRDVYFISVSGRTRANIEAARKTARLCRQSYAITANEESPLASSVDRVLRIPYNGPPRTPGTLSFSLSLLTVILLCRRNVSCDFKSVFEESIKASRKFRISSGGVTYILGNGAAYGSALYASAKICELIGGKSHPELLEEFSHTELFSLTEGDSVNIFRLSDSRNLSQRLQGFLSGSGYSCAVINTSGNEVEQLFRCIFLVQQATYNAAKERGLTRPHFQTAGKLLRTSDEMIY